MIWSPVSVPSLVLGSDESVLVSLLVPGFVLELPEGLL
jgi:hypothetical protein